MKRAPAQRTPAPSTLRPTELSVKQLETVNGGDEEPIIVIDPEGNAWTCVPDPDGGDGDYFCTKPRTEYYGPEDENDFA